MSIVTGRLRLEDKPDRTVPVAFEWPDGSNPDDGLGVFRVGNREDELSREIIEDIRRLWLSYSVDERSSIRFSPFAPLSTKIPSVPWDRGMRTFSGIWVLIQQTARYSVEWNKLPAGFEPDDLPEGPVVN